MNCIVQVLFQQVAASLINKRVCYLCWHIKICLEDMNQHRLKNKLCCISSSIKIMLYKYVQSAGSRQMKLGRISAGAGHTKP